MANATTRKAWQCSINPTHVFDKPTADGFCPKPPAFHGILMEGEVSEDMLVHLEVIASPSDEPSKKSEG